MKKLILNILFIAIVSLTCLSCSTSYKLDALYNDSGLAYQPKKQYDMGIAGFIKPIEMNPGWP